MKKLYITRKYILANSAADAIKKDKEKSVDDVWVDEEWKKEMTNKSKPIGYNE